MRYLLTVLVGDQWPEKKVWAKPEWKRISGKSKWGLCKWGLKVLIHNCPRLPKIVDSLRRKFPLRKATNLCTIAHDCAQIAESGLKPPFESPNLDFPEILVPWLRLFSCVNFLHLYVCLCRLHCMASALVHSPACGAVEIQEPCTVSSVRWCDENPDRLK